MKPLAIAIRTSPVIASFIGAASLVLLAVKVAWLNFVPPLFPHAQDLGLVVEAFLIANFSAYIFFIVTIQLPLVKDKRMLARPIIYSAENVVNRVQGFLQMIAGTHAQPFVAPNDVTGETVKQLFAMVSPNDVAPMRDGISGEDVRWLGAMVLHQRQCKEAIDDVWRFARFLDAELIRLVDDIDRAFQADPTTVELLRRGGHWSNESLVSWAPNYFGCYDLARKLAAYCKEFRTTYAV